MPPDCAYESHGPIGHTSHLPTPEASLILRGAPLRPFRFPPTATVVSTIQTGTGPAAATVRRSSAYSPRQLARNVTIEEKKLARLLVNTSPSVLAVGFLAAAEPSLWCYKAKISAVVVYKASDIARN